MRHLEILKLGDILNARLSYLEGISLAQSRHIKELNAQEIKDNADAVFLRSQIRLETSVLEKYRSEIVDIKNSLKKIESEIYGICEMCDDDISIERLKLKPHAKYCTSCREFYEDCKSKEES
ncbi:TraR/DksA C4-type zinc finger protein [Helicobacter sp. 11S02629-2]|uniref:TraR/DksA C4-type zinc finger protein n=1 Tax=Helicobacter sp. 11S02629-2 TaxID=1476195 RepID=UPI000BA6A4EF|nr:TraR/DksA C4-type zinc finger protein [Helicobacter sp. 11S02629-2]PAF45975.1 hypothetical protein BKH40_00760 [Helicobacter sp. 11S02629-2]